MQQAHGSSLLPVITSTITTTSVTTAMSSNLSSTVSHQRASTTTATPPMFMLSPQLSKSPFTRTDNSTLAISNSNDNNNLVSQPKRSPSIALQSSSLQSLPPKIKLSKLPKNTSVTSHSTIQTKVEKRSTSSKLPIKKEIKQEYLPSTSSSEKEDVKCVDLSMPTNRKCTDKNLKSIKQESGVPDNAKVILNQRSIAISSNISPTYSSSSRSVHLPCLDNISNVPEPSIISRICSHGQTLLDMRVESANTNSSSSSNNAGCHCSTSATNPVTALPSEAQYTTLPTTTQYATVQVAAQYTTVPPATQYTTVPAATQYTTVPPATQYTTVPPATQYTTLPPATQYATVPTATQYVTVSAAAQYTTVPAATQYTTVHAATQYTTVPAATQYTSVPAAAQYTTVPLVSQYTTVQASAPYIPVPTAATQYNTVSMFAPVQEQALDLSGLELLSHSVLQHANRMQSDDDDKRELDQTTFSSQSNESLASEIHVDSPVLRKEDQYVPIDMSSPPPPLVIDIPSEDITLEQSISSREVSQNFDTETFVASPNISSPSAVQPSNCRSNFSLLCALAEQKLLEDGRKEEDDHVICSSVSTSFPSTINTSSISSSSAVIESSFSSYRSEVSASNVGGSTSSVNSSVTVNLTQSSRSISSTSFNVDSSSISQLNNSSFMNNKSNCHSTASSSCASNSSPLDLSLSLTKKNTSSISSASLSTVSSSPTESFSFLAASISSTPIRTVEMHEQREIIPISSKLITGYESSSSDNQNFEGFEDSSMRRTKLSKRQKLAILGRKYREQLRSIRRQYPKDVSKRKTDGQCKRKRCHSDTCRHRSYKNSRIDEDREISLSELERVSGIDTNSANEPSASGESTVQRQVPRLTISVLKPQMRGGEMNHSPRLESRVLVSNSSSENECSSDDEENIKRKPHRRWSMSFISSERHSGRSMKLNLLPPPNEQDELAVHGNISDSSEVDSKIFYTETSLESSHSDHELVFASCSSSQKRKPGRPKKHSPTKKETTETIVAKKHKNISFLMHNPSSSISSKSKVKPKLNAEVSHQKQLCKKRV